MKNAIFIVTLSTAIFTACMASNPNPENKAVIEAVNQFVKSADSRNTEGMKSILHDEFRAVINRLFGNDGVSIMTKEVYLQMLADGKIGGDERKVEILSVDVINNNASVKARFTGKEYVFDTYLLLVKQSNNEWKVINDMPYIAKNE